MEESKYQSRKELIAMISQFEDFLYQQVQILKADPVVKTTPLNETERNDNRCVLCGKSREKVTKLILGVHGGVCIECVNLCNDIIRTQQLSQASTETQTATETQFSTVENTVDAAEFTDNR